LRWDENPQLWAAARSLRRRPSEQRDRSAANNGKDRQLPRGVRGPRWSLGLTRAVRERSLQLRELVLRGIVSTRLARAHQLVAQCLRLIRIFE
jgi:hypothetical protein